MLCINSKGKCWISYDYGNTWKETSIIGTKIDIVDCHLSFDGKYMIASQQGGIWISRDFGKKWLLHTLDSASDIARR